MPILAKYKPLTCGEMHINQSINADGDRVHFVWSLKGLVFLAIYPRRRSLTRFTLCYDILPCSPPATALQDAKRRAGGLRTRRPK